jgi:hypothetical protein
MGAMHSIAELASQFVDIFYSRSITKQSFSGRTRPSLQFCIFGRHRSALGLQAVPLASTPKISSYMVKKVWSNTHAYDTGPSNTSKHEPTIQYSTAFPFFAVS